MLLIDSCLLERENNNALIQRMGLKYNSYSKIIIIGVKSVDIKIILNRWIRVKWGISLLLLDTHTHIYVCICNAYVYVYLFV